MTKVCILHTLYYNFSRDKGSIYSQSSTNGHLYTTAIFWGWTVYTFTLVSTSLQWPLTSVPKVAVVERFNFTTVVFYMTGINHLSKIQLVVYYQCRVLIG